MRTGKIVYVDEVTGRGALVDDTYPEKLYKFVQKGFNAGQTVIYETTNLNPITGHRECHLIIGVLPSGISKVSDYSEYFDIPIIWVQES